MDPLLALVSALSITIFWSGLFNLVYLPLALGYELRRRPTLPSADAPLVSIVVPAYNEAKVIGACVDSLLATSYPRKQIILVDDGSTDETLAIMRRYAERPEVSVVAKRNGGKASALNEGLGRARGEVVFFVDADGIFTDRTIPEMLAGFENERVGAVCGADMPRNRDRPQTHLATIQSHVSTGFVRRALSLIECMPVVSGNIGAFRRSALERTGPFLEGTLGEDLELTWRVHRAGYLVRFQPAALVYAEVPSTLRGLWKQRVRWARGYLQTARLHRDMFANARYGLFGLYLPLNFFNTVVVPLFQLLVLAALLALVAAGGGWQGGSFGVMSSLGLASTFTVSMVALALDRAWGNLKYLYVVPLWVLYSLFISAVMLRAVMLELRGAEQRWNKLDRVGLPDAAGAPAFGRGVRARLRERLRYELALVRAYVARLGPAWRRLALRLRSLPALRTNGLLRAGLALVVVAASFGGGFAAGRLSADAPFDNAESKAFLAPAAPPVRAVGLDIADLAGGSERMTELELRMRALGVTMVGVSAGRIDWTTFRWPLAEENWATVVREAEGDPFGDAVERFGEWAHVSAVVDVFAPRYLDVYPEAAAIDVDGLPSKYQVSTAALTDGRFGDELILMLDYIAKTYPVDSITLTELFYDQAGYGEADLRSYRLYSGRTDWPRTTTGTIDTQHPSVGAWRSAEVARFVERASGVTERHGKELFVDVRVGWGDLGGEGRQSGHDYELLLEHADRLVLWNYFGLSGYAPEYTSEIAAYMERYGHERVIISYGLWTSGGAALDADALRRALVIGQGGPVPHAWVTPSSLLDEAHWRALDEAWGE